MSLKTKCVASYLVRIAAFITAGVASVHALATPVTPSDCANGFAAIRSTNDFGAAAISEFRALDILGHPTIAIRKEDGVIAWMTPKARTLLEKHFGELPNPNQMPAATEPWLSRSISESAQSESTAQPKPVLRLSNGGEEVRLQIRGELHEDGLVLVGIREFSLAKLLSDVGQRYGLTPRESEVFYWVAQGKTNPDIGQILGASRDTVRKHIENIYAKLGLSNRTQPGQMLNRDFPDYRPD